MIEHLKRLADKAAQQSFHRLLEHHEKTGKWDRQMWSEWSVAEALFVEAGRASERMAHEAAEGDSTDVPVAAITESEYRALWGDR